MFSQKELKEIDRRKQTIVARNDRLREECAEIWSALDGRVEKAERGVSSLQWLPPVLSLASACAMIYLKSRKARTDGAVEPLLSVASLVLNRSRRGPSPKGH